MRQSILWAVVTLITLGVSTLGVFGGGAAWAVTWGKDYIPNLPVVTQDGDTLRFYDDLIKDKIVVIDFVYTNCKDVCPLMTSRLAQVQKRLGERVGRDIFFYSISLDPERDSPEALKKYTKAFHVGPGWLFLTGKPDDLDLIRHKLGERSRRLSEHQSTIVLGNGTTGEWARTSAMQDTVRLVREIHEMDPAWRAQTRDVTQYVTAAPAEIGGHQGQSLFLKACASCHTVGDGSLIGPDLKGVTARRDRAWLVRYMTAPDRMLAEQDPIAVELAAEFEGAVMPYLGLSDTDAADLIVYIDAQTKQIETAAEMMEHHHHHESTAKPAPPTSQ